MTTGEARPFSGFRLWVCILLALAVGPAGLLGIAGQLPEAKAAPTVITSQTLTTDTVWTTAGSPYWVQNTLRVNAGVRLTIEPGVVVKIGNPTDRYGQITVAGQLVVRGSAAAPVIFTSHRDDSVAGDTNGDGAATAPARGDWYHIYFSNEATKQSVVDRSIVQYGGYGSGGVCGPYAELRVAAGASLSLTNSDLRHSQFAGVGVASGAGDVRVANNRFYESHCGVSAPSGAFSENVFESTLTGYTATFLGSSAVSSMTTTRPRPFTRVVLPALPGSSWICRETPCSAA